MPPLRFGVLFGLHTNPVWSDVSAVDAFSAVPRLAETVERSGFDSIFFTEHHGSPNSECPSPLIACAAAAAVTDRLVLGTGVALAPFYHPLKLAEDVAVLDNISRGRALLSLGIGYRESEFAGFGIPLQDRLDHLRDTLEVLSLAWSGETFDYAGRLHQLTGARLSPAQVQQPVPIWLGAQRRAALRRAARLGLPVPIAVAPLALACRQRRMYLEALAEEGNNTPGIELPVIREAFCAPTDEQAWDLAGPYLANLYRDDYGRFASVPVREPSGGYRFESDHTALFPSGIEEFARDRVLIGSPATIMSELVRHSEELPCTHWVLRMQLAGMAPEIAAASIELFGAEVIPWAKEESWA